jgi:hypothetical protein
MIRRVVRMPFAFVLRLGIAAIACGGCSSVFAQTSSRDVATPHLVFSTYLGGATACADCSDVRTFAQNAASDAWGNTYVTGATTVSDLATPFACQGKPAPHSTLSAFVVKYDAYGRLLWCTYMGGNKQSMGVGVAVMPDGGVAVGGMTQSDGSEPFPTLNAFQKTYAGGKSDYFVSVFDAKGKLRYSTYLGGSDLDGEVNDMTGNYEDNGTNGNNIGVDANGLVYLTGITKSRGGPPPAIKFPVTRNAIQPDMKSDNKNAFLCILDPAKSGQASLLYCSFLGGSGDDNGHGIAVNANGSAIAVAGFTSSTDFPTTPNGYQSTPPPDGFNSNGFVAQFQVAQYCIGSVSCHYKMQYSTYLGGQLNEGGGGPRTDTYGIGLDSMGLIVAAGRTQDADFPMTPYGPSIYNSAPYLLPGKSGDQPYLVKINPWMTGKASLAYSTFLGGDGFGTVVAVDPWGNGWVAGENDADGIVYTPSRYPVESPKLFPYTKNALIPSHLGAEGVRHAILMQTTLDGASLGYSTYLGGTLSDRSYGLAADRVGNVVVSGLTFSQDFPLKNPAQGWPPGSIQNAFVTKFSSQRPYSR